MLPFSRQISVKIRIINSLNLLLLPLSTVSRTLNFSVYLNRKSYEIILYCRQITWTLKLRNLLLPQSTSCRMKLNKYLYRKKRYEPYIVQEPIRWYYLLIINYFDNQIIAFKILWLWYSRGQGEKESCIKYEMHFFYIMGRLVVSFVAKEKYRGLFLWKT